MNKTILIFITVIFALHVKGQSLIRSSINCLGNSTVNQNILFRQSAGQASNTEVFTNGIVLRQGFQQPISSAVTKPYYQINSFKLFPNPANNQTAIVIEDKFEVASVKITDILGRDFVYITNYTPNSKIDCSSLVSGLYIVTLYIDNQFYATTELLITK